MRTTLTLPDSHYQRIVDLAHERKISFKDAAAEVIGLGLDAADRIAAAPYRFEIKSHRGGPTNPNLNYDNISELLAAEDELDGRAW